MEKLKFDFYVVANFWKGIDEHVLNSSTPNRHSTPLGK